eukprot:scaffold71162_cov73-Phaeocystis_antarctica.AAC.8
MSTHPLPLTLQQAHRAQRVRREPAVCTPDHRSCPHRGGTKDRPPAPATTRLPCSRPILDHWSGHMRTCKRPPTWCRVAHLRSTPMSCAASATNRPHPGRR